MSWRTLKRSRLHLGSAVINRLSVSTSDSRFAKTLPGSKAIRLQSWRTVFVVTGSQMRSSRRPSPKQRRSSFLEYCETGFKSPGTSWCDETDSCESLPKVTKYWRRGDKNRSQCAGTRYRDTFCDGRNSTTRRV